MTIASVLIGSISTLAFVMAVPLSGSATCAPDSESMSIATSGLLSKSEATAITDYTIGTGQAFDIIVYWFSSEGVRSQTIRATDGGDKMHAFFADGKLFTYNAIDLRGEAHCCNSQVAVQRFRLDTPDLALRLQRELLAVVNVPPFDDTENCPSGSMSSATLEWRKTLRDLVLHAGQGETH